MVKSGVLGETLPDSFSFFLLSGRWLFEPVTNQCFFNFYKQTWENQLLRHSMSFSKATRQFLSLKVRIRLLTLTLRNDWTCLRPGDIKFWKFFFFNSFLHDFRLHFVYVDAEKYYEFVDKAVCEHSNHAAMRMYRETKDEIELKYRSGTSSVHTLEEDYATHHYGIVFMPFNPYFATFNDAQMRLESNGIVERWRKNKKNRKIKPEEIGPQVLTLEHLRFGFFVCCIAGVVSLLAVIGELAWSKLRLPFRKFCHETFMKQLKINANYKFDDSQEATADSSTGGDEQNGLQEVMVEVFLGHQNGRCAISEAEEIELLEKPKSVTSSKMKKSEFKLNHKSDDDTDSIDVLIQKLTSN